MQKTDLGFGSYLINNIHNLLYIYLIHLIFKTFKIKNKEISNNTKYLLNTDIEEIEEHENPEKYYIYFLLIKALKVVYMEVKI